MSSEKRNDLRGRAPVPPQQVIQGFDTQAIDQVQRALGALQHLHLKTLDVDLEQRHVIDRVLGHQAG